MKIYTLTLNPAYDVHAYAEHFEPFHENLAAIQSREAGGKGLNISRALNNNNIPNSAVIVLGSENGADFKQHLSVLEMDCLLFEKEGRIRENLTLHCADSPETRISFAGFKLEESILSEVKSKLDVDNETIITFTGRVPDGIGMDKIKSFLSELKNQGARIVLDSRSFTLADIYEVEPWLVKPNQEEISEFFGCTVEGIDDAVAKAKEFAAHGIANVMVSLGEQGALLIAQGNTYIANPPKIKALSTIGAGDSSIAGFIAATLQGKQADQCLKTAVAFGTAACLTEGSQPPLKQDVDEIYKQVKITLLP